MVYWFMHISYFLCNLIEGGVWAKASEAANYKKIARVQKTQADGHTYGT
jgi:hypothetical protein